MPIRLKDSNCRGAAVEPKRRNVPHTASQIGALRRVVDPRLLLAAVAEEGGALRLDDPSDRPFLAAGTRLARFRVDAVLVLVAA